jgi:NACalpha-BTF3-like transcription factor
MAEFGTKAAEDFTDAVNTELAREPFSLISEGTVAETIKSMGGLLDMFNNMPSGGGAGGAVTPTPTETVTVQADLEFQDIEFIDDADLDEEDIDKVIERTNLVKNQINSIAQSMANFIDSTFKSIIAGTATFEEVMRDMIKQMLIQLASLIAQFAILSVLMPSSLVGKGGNVMSLGKFIGGGFGIPQMASGGIVSGPVIAQVGEYAGAQHNPEVIAPLDKLQSMMGGQAVQVTGKISGRDILLTSERNAIDRNRVRGF